METYEILEASGLGWYGYRPWGVAGEYFFNSYQAHSGEGIFYGTVRPSPFYCGVPNIEYFDSQQELLDAIALENKK